MANHSVVIGVTEGTARVIKGDPNVEVITLDFINLDEYGDNVEKEYVDRLIEEKRYDQIAHYLDAMDDWFLNRA